MSSSKDHKQDKKKPKRSLLDHRSTSSSPNSKKNKRAFLNLPSNIEDFIDMESPILKHLIEIEDKYWNSKINQNFKLPRKDSYQSVASSDMSMKGVTTYNLASQNKKKRRKRIHSNLRISKTLDSRGKGRRPRSKKRGKKERSLNYSYEKSYENFRGARSYQKLKSYDKSRSKYSRERSHNAKAFNRLKRKLIVDQNISKSRIKKSRSPNRRSRSPREMKIGKLRKTHTSANLSSPRGFVKKDRSLNTRKKGDRLLRDKPLRKEKGSKRLLEPNVLNNYKVKNLYRSKRKVQSMAKGTKRVQTNSVKNINNRSKILRSYAHHDKNRKKNLHLYKSKIDRNKIQKGKNFLVKFQEVFAKRRKEVNTNAVGNSSYLNTTKKDSKRKSRFYIQNPSSKGKKPMIASSTSRLIEKLKIAPNGTRSSKFKKNKEVFRRIGSEFLTKHTIRPKSRSKSKSGARTKKLRTPTESGNLMIVSGTGLRSEFRTFNPSGRGSSGGTNKSRIRGSGGKKRSSSRISKYATVNSALGARKSTPKRKRVADSVKIAEIEKQIFTSTFKHRIWNKIFSKSRVSGKINPKISR